MTIKWKDLPLGNLFYFGLGVNILTSVAVIILRGLLPPVVPLFYGLPVGANQLTSTLGLIIAPAVSVFIIAINYLISLVLENVFLQKVLAITSLSISVLTTLTIIKIMFLVGFF